MASRRETSAARRAASRHRPQLLSFFITKDCAPDTILVGRRASFLAMILVEGTRDVSRTSVYGTIVIMREIVNVQIGTFANHIGAHFWNLQDEYLATPLNQRQLSPSVLFRESRGSASYSPRVQVVDLTGAFGSLSLNAGTVLANTPETGPLTSWAGPAQTYCRARVQTSAYIDHLLAEEASAEASAPGSAPASGNDNPSGAAQHYDPMEVDEVDFGLDRGVTYWTDFLKTRLHPRTCFSLPGMHAGVVNFDKFDHGLEAATLRLCDDMYDDLRFFLEECDSLGGVHVTANADDGFAGITSTYLTRMRDELGSSTPLFVVGTNGDRNPNAETTPLLERTLRHRDQRLAEARLVAECMEVEAQYVPVETACTAGLEYVHPLRFNNYHSSAVIALALDVGYIPLRFSSARISTSGMINLIRPAPFAMVSSLFSKFPVVPLSTKPIERGYFYNRESMTKLSQRTFSTNSVHLAGAGSSSPSRRVCEVVSSRGVLNEGGFYAALTSPITLPVAYPRFFDHRISISGTLRAAASICVGSEATNGEVGQVSSISGFATSGSEGSTFLRNLGAVLSQSTEKESTRHSGENSTLDEVKETLTGLAADYGTI